MNIEFLTNDLLEAWNILFTKSVSQNFSNLKRKLWNTYKIEYNENLKDKNQILKDHKNFIPNNDTVYNAIIEKEDFELFLKEADKTRINTMKLWNKYSKQINHLMKDIIRKKIATYKCFVVNKDFEIIEVNKINNDKGTIIVGKNYSDEKEFLVNFIYEIIKTEINTKEKDTLGIKEAILEMTILNEFKTTLDKTSHYKDGNPNLFYLKKQIYPYWLMYLGISKENMVKYMIRDKIAFEVNSFAYEKELINMNLEEFIDFIIRNKRYIVRTEMKEANKESKININFDNELI